MVLSFYSAFRIPHSAFRIPHSAFLVSNVSCEQIRLYKYSLFRSHRREQDDIANRVGIGQ